MPGTNMFMICSQLEEDMKICQDAGKKILISIGGDPSSPYQLNNDNEGQEFADVMWHMFGPKPAGWTGPRPFGDNIVDGFDFDIEANGGTGYGAMASALRSYMDSDQSKQYLLTAAPQCIVPDAQLADALTKAQFDHLYIQFYNTPSCSARSQLDPSYGSGMTFDTWATWLAENAHNGIVPQLYIGLPGSTTAVTDPEMYLDESDVASVLAQFYNHPNFAGVMIWEATAAKNNNGFVGQVRLALNEQQQCSTPGCLSSTTTTTVRSQMTKTADSRLIVADHNNDDDSIVNTNYTACDYHNHSVRDHHNCTARDHHDFFGDHIVYYNVKSSGYKHIVDGSTSCRIDIDHHHHHHRH